MSPTSESKSTRFYRLKMSQFRPEPKLKSRPTAGMVPSLAGVVPTFLVHRLKMRRVRPNLTPTAGP